MKITRIDIEGDAGFRATLRLLENYLEILVVASRGAEKRLVHARDGNDQFEAAGRLQRALDGCCGTNSMIRDYYRLIRQLAD